MPFVLKNVQNDHRHKRKMASYSSSSSSSSSFICATQYSIKYTKIKTLQCNSTERHKVHLQLLFKKVLKHLKVQKNVAF